MKQWLSLPRDVRRELRQTYREAGYSRMESVRDFESNGTAITSFKDTINPDWNNSYQNNINYSNAENTQESILDNNFTPVNSIDELDRVRASQSRNIRENIPIYTPSNPGLDRDKVIEDIDTLKTKLIDDEYNNRLTKLESSIPVEEYTPPLEITSEISLKNPIELQTKLFNAGYNIGESGVDGKIGKNTIQALQKYLVDQGYDLGNYGINEDGVDGVMGEKTRQALNHYNDNINGKPGIFSNKENSSWDCPYGQTQCAASIDHILINEYGLKSDERLNAGIFGDAWHRERNMLRNNGQLLFKKESGLNNTNQFAPGDMVFLHNTHGISSSQRTADAAYGAPNSPTHTGLVDSGIQYDSQNKQFVYVVHNIRGKVYRDKLYLENSNSPRLGGRNSHYELSSAVRPNLDFTESIKITPNPDITINSRDNPVARNASTALMDLGFRENARRYYGLTEEESIAIAQATLGVMEQESGMGEIGKFRAIPNTVELLGKEMIAGITTNVKNTTIGNKIEKIIDKRIPEEASRGYSQIKFNTNFNDRLAFYESVFGINKDNISILKDDGTNSARASYLILANYFNQLKKDNDPAKALYLAVQKYNRFNLNTEVAGKTSKEWAEEFSLDYSNKVLDYSTLYSVVDKEGNYISTFWDRLNANPDIVKNQFKVSRLRNN
jgi:hypothetical protein